MPYATWGNIVRPEQRAALINAAVVEIRKLQKLVKKIKLLRYYPFSEEQECRIGIATGGEIRSYYGRAESQFTPIKGVRELRTAIEDWELTPQAIAKISTDLRRRAALKVWRPTTRNRKPK